MRIENDPAAGPGVPAWQAYAIAAVLAAAQIAWLFPPAFLAGHSAFFFDGDIAKDIAGWLAYAQTPWGWPLLHTAALNAPEGLSIALTDSIPLMALLFKPFAAWLPPGFHYFGLWHALAFLGQALAAVFLVRGLGARGWLAAFAAAALALNAPVLLHRFGHSALMAQGLILLALGLYTRRLIAPARILAWLIVVCWTSLLIHPYLFLMSMAILAATLIDIVRATGRWRCALVALLVALAGGLALAGALGLLAAGMSTGAYGQYSLRLNAPFCGGEGAAFFTCDPGGGESMAYLGAGGLLLVLAALLRPGRAWRALWRAHAGLVLVGIGLAALAVSHVIGIGQHIVLTLPLPEALLAPLGSFQASARLFWPIGYLLVFAALAAVLRQGRLGVVLVLVALVLQWPDTATRRAQIQASAAQPAYAMDAQWPAALQGVTQVALYPAFGCGTLDTFAYLPVQYQAARQGATFNTAYAARGRVDCSAKRAALEGTIPPDALWLAPASLPTAELPAGLRQAAEAGHCRTLEVIPRLWDVPRPTTLLACRHAPPGTP